MWLLAGLLPIPLNLLAAEEGSHVVSSFSFAITGITKERALLERKRQDLVNDRVFKSVEIRDVVGETVDGKTGHAATVAVVDAFSLFPLPYPSYDSNEGLELGVETHYDNGLGTMTNWYLKPSVVAYPGRRRRPQQTGPRCAMVEV